MATSYVKSPYPHYKEGIAVYFVSEKQWKQYDVGDVEYVWAISIAPDGSTLAFKTERDWSEPRQLLLLDLETGETIVLINSFATSPPLSWSPDGRHVVYEHPFRPDPNVDSIENEIRIRDVQNGSERRLVSGSFPSWSPSGEWIAYLDVTSSLAIVHPDGTDATALASLRRQFPWFYRRYLMYPPVWSPDSKALLLNEDAADDTGRLLIHQFDFESGKLRRKRGAGVAILGWTH